MKINVLFSDSEEKDLILDLEEDLLIYDLKNMINQCYNFRIDSIEILSNRKIKMHDNSIIEAYQINENDSLTVKIEKNCIKVVIEVFQKNLEKVVLNLSICASIYMIKKIIEKKTKIDSKQQVLYMDNRILNDSESISDFHSLNNFDKYMKSKSFDGSIDHTETSSPRFLKLKLLLKQSGSKFKLGLDFSFNYLKSLKKINWDEDAPDYREITDGLCLICYCQNQNCGFYNQMFVHNLGQGKFEIIQEITKIYCYKCLSNFIDVRNIGFVNCEWIYKAILKQNSASRVSGEGKTMDRKLHTFKEVNINNIFEKLFICVNEIDIKNCRNEKEKAELASKIIINENEKFLSNIPLQQSIVNTEYENKNKILIDEILNRPSIDDKIENNKSKCLII